MGQKHFVWTYLAKCIAVAALLLGVTADGRSMSSRPPYNSAVRILRVTFDRPARGKFVQQVKTFAETYHFGFRAKHNGPAADEIMLYLWRDEIELIVDNTSEPTIPGLRFDIAFYLKYGGPLSAGTLDPLVEGIRRFVGETPGAVVVEKK